MTDFVKTSMDHFVEMEKAVVLLPLQEATYSAIMMSHELWSYLSLEKSYKVTVRFKEFEGFKIQKLKFIDRIQGVKGIAEF